MGCLGSKVRLQSRLASLGPGYRIASNALGNDILQSVRKTTLRVLAEEGGCGQVDSWNFDPYGERQYLVVSQRVRRGVFTMVSRANEI